jgi:hypothetical protein
LAEAVGAHFEPGAVSRKGILAEGPRVNLGRGRGSLVVLTVVEDNLKHPARVVDLILCQKERPLALVIQQRRAVAIIDALEIAVGLAAVVIRTPTIGFVGLC